ncbi:zinc finger CCCH-type antiviral protein 1 [Octopus bimaculoides]|uniref:Poly [ADP-ribose] polymerase n=1 Tax=Octopus bimaculoides TaxID=37653 RepID=A0A0L8HJ68_OCTBM|nr:zinc finger CCCH-type antiviral protein 1 [Octopus bimaculoides]|eukprot:XP_014771982.1 PREDICTED: zinc finger CCCH-type antiviral protein 1-like [Octopus bimaculoides]
MAAAPHDFTLPVFKFLCREGSNGLNIYSIVENLSHSSNDLHLNLSYVRKVINNPERFHQDDGTIYPKTFLRICGHPVNHDKNCTSLHLCKFYLLSDTCTYGKKCIYGHNFESEHNMKILKEHELNNLSLDEVRGLLKTRCNRTSETTPLLCIYHNSHEKCRKDVNCHCIHICKKFLDSKCQGKNCNRNHDIDNQVTTVLEKFGFDTDLDEESIIELIKTVTELKFEEVQAPSCVPSKPKHKQETSEFCRYFLKGGCSRENCKFIHSRHPYMWCYYEEQWLNFPEQVNEQIEKQYADPNLKTATLFQQHNDISEINFEKMLASKLDGEHLKIERKQASHSSINWVWYWRAKPETWIEMSKSGIEEENKIIEKSFNSKTNLKLHFKESNTYAVLDVKKMVLIHKSIPYPVCRRPEKKD